MKSLDKGVDTRVYDAELHEEETERGGKQGGVRIDNSGWRQQELDLEPP